jgi:hypothetical protein
MRKGSEFAEELAIRTWTHTMIEIRPFRIGSGGGRAKNSCLGALLGDIGKSRDAAAQEVFRQVGARRGGS